MPPDAMKLPRPLLSHGLASVGLLVFAFGFQLQAAPPVAVNDSVVMHHLQKARIAALANDTGNVSSPTVAIMQAPQWGSAVADSSGRILYTHQSGTPASDSFTYRVTSAEGTSNAATVTVAFSNSLRISGGFNIPATPPPLAVQLTPVVTGLASPTAIATPPGETRRVFVCQKGGLLRLVQDITASTPAVSTFLNLANVLTAGRISQHHQRAGPPGSGLSSQLRDESILLPLLFCHRRRHHLRARLPLHHQYDRSESGGRR